MSEVLKNDLEYIASDKNIPWQEFDGKTVLITGATGLIGSALVRSLFAARKKYSLNLIVLALGRDINKAKVLTDLYGAEFLEHDICKPLFISENVDYIFHCAAITQSAIIVSEPVKVIETSFNGTNNILRFAKEKQIKSMVYLSSMEVYGETNPSIELVTEEMLGYIDLKNPRSSYPESKRMCESLCSSWHEQYGVPVRTARPAQTFGAGTSHEDQRVFAQFARSAIAGENIVLHTEGKSRGNYCYTSDVVRGLITVLLKGVSGEAYNISNMDASVTIREMAELVAYKVADKKVEAVIEIPNDIEKRGYAPDVTMRLSSEKLMKLGWKPEFGLEEMYRRMISDWRENS